jgi:pimeloyl-ACP methyl ester carboxylesterase
MMTREKDSPAAVARDVLPGIRIEPKIISTAAGPVEYDLTDGDGPVVLGLHGGLGGCDQGRAMTGWLEAKRFRILSPSRPGYLGTPLETGQTMEAQADAMAALLDALGIEKVAVMGASAGGPPAYYFAIRHPDRTAGLVVIDGISGYYDIPETAGAIMHAIFLSNLGQKLFQKIGKLAPMTVLKALFTAESYFTKKQMKRHIEATLADEEAMHFVRAFLRSMSPYKHRKPGTENDIHETRQYTHIPVVQVQAPTLIVHGTHDADVKFYDGVYAYETIPHAQRFWIEEGSHLSFWIHPHRHDAQQAVREFLGQCLS